MTQISNMKIISLMVDFLKIKLWHLSIEFYGEWQLFATHHRTCKKARNLVVITYVVCRDQLEYISW